MCMHVGQPMPCEKEVIHIIEEHDSLRQSLIELFRQHQYKVYEYRTGLEFLEHQRPLCHGCILLNLNLPKMSGLELQSVLLKRKNPTPIIFLSDQHDVGAAVEAMKKGAQDFIELPAKNELLLLAIRTAIESSRDTVRRELAMQSLTSREKDVAELVLQSKLNKETAYLLNISEKTVEFHRKNIRQKLAPYSDVINI